MTHQITIRPHGYFKALLHSPDQLQMLAQDYFGLTDLPTIPGFAAYAGIDLKSVSRIVEDDITKGTYPEESLAILASVLTNIEAVTLENGLTEETHAMLTKYVLSAYHGRSEKIVQEQHQSGKVEIVFRDDTMQDQIIEAEVRQLEDKMLGHIESTKNLAEVVGAREDDLSIFKPEDDGSESLEMNEDIFDI